MDRRRPDADPPGATGACANQGYKHIVDEMGYQNRGSVYTIIKQAQRQHVADGVEYHRDVELARLNSLRAALRPRAEQGDAAAAWACLKIIMARCRLSSLRAFEPSRSPAGRSVSSARMRRTV